MSVHTICEDREGGLLVGGTGLLVLRRRTRGRALPLDREPADNSIRTIRETRDGARLDRHHRGPAPLEGGVRGNPFTPPRMVDGTNISVLRESRSGAAVDRHLRPRPDALRRGPLVTLSAPASLPHDNVLAVFEDAEDNVWVGTQGGLLRLQPARREHDHDERRRAVEHQHHLRGSARAAPRHGAERAAVPGRASDARAGGAAAGAAGLVDPQRLPRQQGRLWIGTDGQGVARARRRDDRPLHDEGRARERFRARLLRGSRGRHLDRHRRRPELLARRARSATSPRRRASIYGSIRGLLLDHDGEPLGGDRARPDAASGRAPSSPIRCSSALRGTKVWALHQDSDGGLWIGTQGAGLFLLKSGRLTQFTTEHGLPSNKIHFIGEDRRGNLWMSGPSGVVSVARRDLESLPPHASRHVAVRLYGTAEGLNTNQMSGGVQPAGVVTTTGEIWLPSTKGAVLIVPDVPERPAACRSSIEQAIADGRPMPLPGRARPAARRRQARDPLHLDPPGGAGTAPLQVLDGKLRARLDRRRPAPRRLLHQPAARPTTAFTWSPTR